MHKNGNSRSMCQHSAARQRLPEPLVGKQSPANIVDQCSGDCSEILVRILVRILFDVIACTYRHYQNCVRSNACNCTLRSKALMTYLLKLILVNFWALPKPAGAKHVDLHQLVADDVQPDQKHAVLNQFGSHDFGDVQLQVANFRRCEFAASVNVAAHVAAAS